LAFDCGRDSSWLHGWRFPYSELIGVGRRSALKAFGSGLEWSIGQSFAVTFRSGYRVRLVVLRGVGGVAWVGFGIEV
jgi:hypothetical protein